MDKYLWYQGTTVANDRSRVDLPAQANFLRCARIATKASAQRPHGKATKHASGLGLALGLGFRVGAVAAVSRSRKQYHRRGKTPLRTVS